MFVLVRKAQSINKDEQPSATNSGPMEIKKEQNSRNRRASIMFNVLKDQELSADYIGNSTISRISTMNQFKSGNILARITYSKSSSC